MALETYRKKRDFEKTPEPPGGRQWTGGQEPSPSKSAPASAAKKGGLLYVVQKHAASRLHYDFRLELDGVLLSWAVPKGPSLDPHDRHLAARVEDHPLEYGGFEGIIPKGEYGAGTVELWDRGTWEPEGDPREGLVKGDLKFTLHGEKLKGGWVLARMKPRADEEDKEVWLLIKHRDEYSVDGGGEAVLREQPGSVASGRTLEEITAAAGTSVWHGDQPASRQTDARPGEDFLFDPSQLTNARQTSTMPRFVPPELATLAKGAPEGGEWLHEVKFDGYRALARIENSSVEMYSRSGKDWTGKYRVLADRLAKLPVEAAMLDGEVVVQLPDGRTSFQELQNALSAAHGDEAAQLLYYVFDLLHLNGWDLLDSPIEERKALLKRLLNSGGGLGRVLFSDHISGDGDSFLSEACQLGLEGIVSKRVGSPYRPGARSGEWLKAKCSREQEFVIGGFTDPAGSRTGFGALLLGTYEEGKLRYVGRVGTGFSERLLRQLGDRLRSIEIETPPFSEHLARAPKRSHWVKPELVAEVAFSEWTQGGDVRHPSFKGLRDDKPPAEVVQEKEAPLDTTPAPPMTPAPLLQSPTPGLESMPEQSLVPRQSLAPPSGPASKQRSVSKQSLTLKRGSVPKLGSVDKTGSEPRQGSAAGARRETAAEGHGLPAEDRVYGVALTHLDRVFWPLDQITKRELVEYYLKIGDRMLPYVLNRPISLVRCPDGIKGSPATDSRPGAVRQGHGQSAPCFFHKHPGPGFPGPFERVTIEESGGPETYLTVTEVGSLIGLAQMGVLEIHVWGSSWPDIEHPDTLVFDLDPDPAVEWPALVQGARLMKEVLRALGLESFVKTTGGKGLHVVVPIVPAGAWGVARGFCKSVAEALVGHAPDRFTANMAKEKREGKIYVDYVRNTRGATAIAPYSTRAHERATIAVPLRWSELSGRIRPDTFTIANIRDRLGRLKGDPWDGYLEAQRSQTLVTAIKRAADS